VRARRIATALIGPGSFALAASIGRRREPGYDPRAEPISALAAHGTRAAGVMVPGFLGLAAGTLALARSLRGTAVAPTPVPELIALAGVTVGGAGLARCSDRSCPTRMLGDEVVERTDDLHAAFSAATFALWIAIPFVAAARAKDAAPGFRRASRALGVSTSVALMITGRMAQGDSPWSGTGQRVFLVCALAWYPLAAALAESPARGSECRSRPRRAGSALRTAGGTSSSA
jgi:hypothetical protein